MTPEEIPRIRLVGVPDDAVSVVRGGQLDVTVLRSDAERFRRRFRAWGRFGVSALLARDNPEIDALCLASLERYGTVVVFRRSDLLALGLQVVPTFRRPHVTVAHEDLDALVSGLLACDHIETENPYHDHWGGG